MSTLEYGIEALITDYGNWLRQESSIKSFGDWKEISVPFLDKSNDEICFYVKLDHDAMHFTDDGFTLENIRQAGVSLTGSRYERIQHLAARFGAQIDKQESVTLLATKNYPEAMHRYIQVLLDINAMRETTLRRISGYFVEDVRNMLDSLNVFYTSDVSVRGTSKYEHHFDFIFQRSSRHPTRFCQAPNRFDKDTVRSVMWGWEDTRQTEQRKRSKLIVIGDDREEQLQSTAREAFESCGVTVIPYSELSERAPIELTA